MPRKYIRGMKQLCLAAMARPRPRQEHGHLRRHRGSRGEVYLGHLAEVGKALGTTEGPTSEGVQGSEGTCKQHQERQLQCAHGTHLLGAGPSASLSSPQHQGRSRVLTSVCGVLTLGAGPQPGPPPTCRPAHSGLWLVQLSQCEATRARGTQPCGWAASQHHSQSRKE